ncbi:MAG: glutamyl-tRNA reductase [Propionibacteriales bacterium]|nr:glutamyl-tRNA reductase [Propionibacteriales bacterium]
MSILIVGASHRTASVELLERLALDVDAAAKLGVAALDTEHVSEALVLATCNRIEIYAEVDRFHGSVEDLTAVLAAHACSTVEEVLGSLYVHYDEAAVAHLFAVATGLDSMVVGESQILGQVREALRRGQNDESVGACLNTLFQQGLRVGKRAHSETNIDSAGHSVVSVALAEAAEVIGPLAGARVCIVGAGSVAALAAAAVCRAGSDDVVITSRTVLNAERLAVPLGGHAAPLDSLTEQITQADLVISCTGSTGSVISTEMVTEALAGRAGDRPLVIVDLALPHDVDPTVAEIELVSLVALKTLADSVHNGSALEDVTAVKAIVAEEVTAFAAARDAARVAPTVVALRSMATGVVAAELERLWSRLGPLTPAERDEIIHTVTRVADKLLHEPTVRIKQLAGRFPESSYAAALAELFSLDPATVEAVSRAADPGSSRAGDLGSSRAGDPGSSRAGDPG